ncbi:restriction endonuclease subunit S [Methylobacillus sp.]|uniref:restriction endonuclease subunit S n=1 Tax=Methylobacillus sp. TaxID=56818 RepID=UPI002FE3E9F9
MSEVKKNTKDKAALVPRLRFSEFLETAEWGKDKLGELITTVSPPAKLQSSSYRMQGKFPIIDQSQELICGWTDDESAVIAESLPLIIFGDHTCALKFVENPFAQGADGIKILKAKPTISAEFLFHSLSHHPLAMEDYKRHFSILKERTVVFPDIKSGEQQKIADCLSSLDDLITAETQKLDTLKTHKKGLMQQLFPREGETVPRLRFLEFFDTPEHKFKPLNMLVKFSSGGTPPKAEPAYWEGDIPWISASSMHDMNISDADLRVTTMAIGNGTRLAKKGAILILVRGSMLFKRVPICIALRDVAFNQDVKALTVTPDVISIFLLYQLISLSSRIAVNETGIGAGKIETEILEGLKIWLPDTAEQQRIADCLSSLDDHIAEQSQKIDSLKTHKKGLMQQIFPVMESLE